ncbi:MAG: hypothetical protein ACEQSC_01785 [Candidatus Nanopelagicaceae bacterium]
MQKITITELIQQLQQYKSEIGCDGKTIAAHDLKSEVRFAISNPEVDLDLELQEIEVSLMAGCLCGDGVIFWLKASNG